MPLFVPPKNKRLKYAVYRLIGLAFSVIPAAVCTLSYFPLYQTDQPYKIISLGSLLLLIFSFLPLWRVATARLKTPSATLIWLSVFLLFYLLSAIAEEMIVISFFAFLGNLTGSVFFKLAERSIKEK